MNYINDRIFLLCPLFCRFYHKSFLVCKTSLYNEDEHLCYLYIFHGVINERKKSKLTIRSHI